MGRREDIVAEEIDPWRLVRGRGGRVAAGGHWGHHVCLGIFLGDGRYSHRWSPGIETLPRARRGCEEDGGEDEICEHVHVHTVVLGVNPRLGIRCCRSRRKDSVRIDIEMCGRGGVCRLERGDRTMCRAGVAAQSTFPMTTDTFPFEWMTLSRYVELS